MARERPAKSRWDVKLAPGGLVDIEFVIQHGPEALAADVAFGGTVNRVAHRLHDAAEFDLQPSRQLEAVLMLEQVGDAALA